MKKNIFPILFVLFFILFFYGDHYSRINKTGTGYISTVFSSPDKAADRPQKSIAVYQTLLSRKNKALPLEVVTIFDGDTLQVKGGGQVFNIRLVGIDCPEIGFDGQKDQPFSRTAKHYLMNLLGHHTVTIKPYGPDAYNRQLAEVFLGTENLNLEMIKAGLAEVYTGKRPETFDAQPYLREEAKARQLGTGMWIQGRSYKSPWQWRKEHPRK